MHSIDPMNGLHTYLLPVPHQNIVWFRLRVPDAMLAQVRRYFQNQRTGILHENTLSVERPHMSLYFSLCVIYWSTVRLLRLEWLSVLNFHRLVHLYREWVSAGRINLFRDHKARVQSKLRTLTFLTCGRWGHIRRLMTPSKWFSWVVQVIRASHLVRSWYLVARCVLFSQLHDFLIDLDRNLFQLIRQFLPFLVTRELFSS